MEHTSRGTLSVKYKYAPLVGINSIRNDKLNDLKENLLFHNDEDDNDQPDIDNSNDDMDYSTIYDSPSTIPKKEEHDPITGKLGKPGTFFGKPGSTKSIIMITKIQLINVKPLGMFGSKVSSANIYLRFYCNGKKIDTETKQCEIIDKAPISFSSTSINFVADPEIAKLCIKVKQRIRLNGLANHKIGFPILLIINKLILMNKLLINLILFLSIIIL